MDRKNQKINKLKRILIVTFLMVGLMSNMINALPAGVYKTEDLPHGEHGLPEGKYCMNHGYSAPIYIKQGDTVQLSTKDEGDLTASYIFAFGDNEVVTQYAIWKLRSEGWKSSFGYCSVPNLSGTTNRERAKELYYEAKYYASQMADEPNLLLVKNSDKFERTIDSNGYYYNLDIGVNAQNGTATYSEATEALDNLSITPGDDISDLIKDEDGETTTGYWSNLENKALEMSEPTSFKIAYEGAQKTYEHQKSAAIFIKDTNGVLWDISEAFYQTNRSEAHLGDETNITYKNTTQYTSIKDRDNPPFILAKNESGETICLWYNGTKYIERFKIATGEHPIEMVVSYETEEVQQEITVLGYGAGANNWLNINSIEIQGINREDKAINTTISDATTIQSIVEQNFKIPVTEEFYDAKAVTVKINYSYLSFDESLNRYTEFIPCDEDGDTYSSFAGYQTLIEPNVRTEYKQESISVVSSKEGNRYLNIGLNKYEGSDAKITTKPFKGTGFELYKGKASKATGEEISDINEVIGLSYEELKAQYSNIETIGKIDKTENTSEFRWRDIKLQKEDILRQYIVLKVHEDPEISHIGIEDFYVIGKIEDKSLDGEGIYYLVNPIIKCSEKDKEKILFNSNNQSSMNGITKNMLLNVANETENFLQLELLKSDNNGKLLDNIKFDVEIEKKKNGVPVTDDETENPEELTTKEENFTLDSFGTREKVHGATHSKVLINDISTVKLSFKEKLTEEQKLEYTDLEFSVELGVKKVGNLYVVSPDYNETTEKYTFQFDEVTREFSQGEDGTLNYRDANKDVGVRILNPGTQDAVVQVLVTNNKKTASFKLHKTDLSIPSINVEDIEFKLDFAKVPRTDYSSETALKSITARTNKDGNIDVESIPLATMNTATEYLKVTIQETANQTGNPYYDIINEGNPFAFIVEVKEEDAKYVLSNIVDKINWPNPIDNHGSADDPVIDANDALGININIRDKYEGEGKYSLKLLKTDKWDTETTLAGAVFNIKINGNLVENPNATSPSDKYDFTTNAEGIIQLDEIKIENNNTQTISIFEKEAPSGYNKVKDGWFTITAPVMLLADGNYRLDGTWNEIENEDEKLPEDATVRIASNSVVVFEIKDERTDKDRIVIDLEKADLQTRDLVKGAQFQVTVDEGEPKIVTIDDIATRIVDQPILPGTTQITVKLKEVAVPEKNPDGQIVRYIPVANGEEFSFTIPIVKNGTRLEVDEDEDHIQYSPNIAQDDININAAANPAFSYVQVRVYNDYEPINSKYRIELVKVDATNSTKLLDNAEFSISVNGNKLTDATDGDETFTTVGGKITTNYIELTNTDPQRISFTELVAPTGYQLINSGNAINVELQVKQNASTGKYYIDSAVDHTFFPAGYSESITYESSTDTYVYRVVLPDEKNQEPDRYVITINKKNANPDRQASAKFELYDKINAPSDAVILVANPSGTSTFDIKSANISQRKISIQMKEIENDNGWGMIPEFTVNASLGTNNKIIASSVEITSADPNFAIYKPLIIPNVSADGFTMAFEITNPYEGHVGVELYKKDKDRPSNVMSGVKFNVTVTHASAGTGETTVLGSTVYETGADGILRLPNITITSPSGYIYVKVHELTFDEGNTKIQYYKEIPDFAIRFTKTMIDKSYTITDATFVDANDLSRTIPNPSGFEITLNGDSTNKAVAITVPNERRILRLSGNIWEDIPSSGKISEVNGQKDPGEKYINGITVKIHGTEGDTILDEYISIVGNKEKQTSGTLADGSEAGYYYFDVPMYEGSYYIEYVYNGYKFQHTMYTPWDGTGVKSNATETEADRDNLNNKFGIIDKTSVNNAINKTKVTDTSYGNIDISIHAFTGGFGSQNLVTFSAFKGAETEGKCDNKTGANETTNYVEGALINYTIDGKTYDYVYSNINLGITPRENVLMGLAKSVNKVELYSQNGISQTYDGTDPIEELTPTGDVVNKSGEDFKNTTAANRQIAEEKAKDFAGQYNVGLSIEDAYTRIESAETGNIPKITARITYRIALYNYASEIGIQFNEIVDYFDESFKFIDAKLEGGSGTITAKTVSDNKKALNLLNEDDSAAGTLDFYELHLKLDHIRLNPGATQYIDVTFEMEPSPDTILRTDRTTGAILPTEDLLHKIHKNVAEVYSYTSYYANVAINSGRSHTYLEHKTYNGTDETFEIAGILDEQSNPGNVNGLKATGIALVPHRPVAHEMDDGIAFIGFIERETRRLGGTVWIEDRKQEEEGAWIGDGIMNESGRVAGVKVELFEYLSDGSERKAIVFNGSEWVNSGEKWTDDDGKYTPFEGIAPGDYYILFTYPDGQTYKSTIFNKATVPAGFLANPDSNDGLHMDMSSDEPYSHARDKWGNATTAKTRQFVNNVLASTGEENQYVSASYNDYITDNTGINDTNKNLTMEAFTGHLNVGFERTDDTIYNISVPAAYTSVEHAYSIIWQFTREYQVHNINLGLVERPKAQLQATKKVTNVKLDLQNGTTLFDAIGKATNVIWNPSQKIEVDDIKEPNYHRATAVKGNIYLTMDEELMQGANIKIKYNIQVENIGEINYKDQEFYYLGNESAPSTNIVKTTVKEIVDYVGYQSDSSNKATRNNLKYVDKFNTDLGWTEKTLKDFETGGSEVGKLSQGALYGTHYNPTDANSQQAGASLYNTILVNDLSKNADGSNNSAATLVPTLYSTSGNSINKDLTLSSTISSNSNTDDLTYNNLVEIISLKNDVGRRTAYSTVGNQDPTDEAGPAELDTDQAEEVVILPPYGQAQNYYIIGTAIVLILAMGLASAIIIKKKKQ